MRHSMSAPAAAAALVVAFTAGPAAAQSAADACLSAPNGGAPKGQHWYYHLDHANSRKCWYLRDVDAAGVKPAAAPSRHVEHSRPAAVTPHAAESAPSEALAAQPAARGKPLPPAADPWPAPSRPTVAAAAPPAVAATPQGAPAKPADVQTAAPATAPRAASVWADSPPAPATSVGNGSVAADPQPTAAVAAPQPTSPVTAVRHAPVRERVASPRETHAAALPVSDGTSASSVAQNLFIILLAALLAGGVFGALVVLRRRKPATVGVAASGPRFGSRTEREDGLWLKWPRRERNVDPAAPVQGSMIPQQVRVTRHPAPRH